MKVLVTGASGFVGSAVVRRLLSDGFEVRAMVRKRSPRANLDGLDVDVVEADLTERRSLDKAAKGCRGVFHVAADYRIWTPDPDAMFAANVEGTKNVMWAAVNAGAERIVHTSSVATMGTLPNGMPADEETLVEFVDMIGPYKKSKYLAEDAVRRLIAEEGMPVVTVNPSTPIGPRDIRPTPTGRLIVEAAAGHMPAFVDTGLNIVHVNDVAAGHLLAFERGAVGERYILGGEDMTLGQILSEIAAIVGRRPPRLRLPHGLVMPIAYAVEAWARLSGREDEPFVTVDGLRMSRKMMYFSSAKAMDSIGYKPRPARQALRDAVAWFRDNGYWA
jgi:dihydroflavonol-4-reductase